MTLQRGEAEQPETNPSSRISLLSPYPTPSASRPGSPAYSWTVAVDGIENGPNGIGSGRVNFIGSLDDIGNVVVDVIESLDPLPEAGILTRD